MNEFSLLLKLIDEFDSEKVYGRERLQMEVKMDWTKNPLGKKLIEVFIDEERKINELETDNIKLQLPHWSLKYKAGGIKIIPVGRVRLLYEDGSILKWDMVDLSGLKKGTGTE